MNKHVMALAVYLALQPVVALSAETMNAERRQQYSNPSAEAQRYRELPNSGQPESGRKQGDVAKSCIPMRTGNPNGVASQEANRPGGLRNDCEPGTEPRGRASKVTVAQNPTKGIAPGPGDAIERGKQRAERTRERQQALMEAADRATKEKKCKNKLCPIFETSN